MSFYATQEHPNRKDWRKPGKSDPSCNPGGSCPRCQSNRQHATRKRIDAAESTRLDLVNPQEQDTDSKVTQAFTREQRICESHDEGSPRSPGNRHSGSLVGHQGKRSSTEHAVSEANPRSGMTSRAGEAR